jgi:hypothetical protein
MGQLVPGKKPGCISHSVIFLSCRYFGGEHGYPRDPDSRSPELASRTTECGKFVFNKIRHLPWLRRRNGETQPLNTHTIFIDIALRVRRKRQRLRRSLPSTRAPAGTNLRASSDPCGISGSVGKVSVSDYNAAQHGVELGDKTQAV